MSEPAESTQDTTIGTEGAPEENTDQQPTSQTANSTEKDEVKLKENGTGAPREEEPKPAVAPPPAKPKYRHDWYQTPTDVYINVMIKNLKTEDVSVDFEEKRVSLIIVLKWFAQLPGNVVCPINDAGSNLFLIDDNY